MAHANHALVRRFIDAMSAGAISDDLVTEDFEVFIVAHRERASKDAYARGIALLPRVFPEGLSFRIRSLTAEDDRVIAEFSGDGTTAGGAHYHNDYLYLFRIRDGKVCFLAEYLDLDAMRGVLIPAMQALAKD